MIEFDIQTPVDGDTLARNVRHALTLGLPELRDFEYPWAESLNVIGNGPSALKADLPAMNKTLAINGALALFEKARVNPTYWAACDPQPLVADFLERAPYETTYLVASKCHPSVFERLQDHNVILWHVHDTPTMSLTEGLFPVSRAVSVTICIFELMARMGFRAFDTWGWDCCLMDGQENAVAQFNGMVPQDVLVGASQTENGEWLGGQLFKTTNTWALEAQDAIMALRGFPFPIHIHGGGMVGEILSSYRPGVVTDGHASRNFHPNPAPPVTQEN